MSVSPPEDALTYRFDGFVLDAADRQLWHDGERVDLNARYFDALALLVREHGRLVEKDRFFEDVWGDVVVSDSALTQCVKDIRKCLGDDAAAPRYIQTVPRHGYRFVAPVEVAPEPPRGVELAPADARGPRGPVPAPAGHVPPRPGRLSGRTVALWAGAGALGGGFAGILGGLLYGTALAYSPTPRLGSASIVLVLIALNVALGALGGAGVSGGMALASWIGRRALRWSAVGAALGGLLVGGTARLLGLDAFTLLFGQAPTGITGGLEGAALGAALALGARLGEQLGPRATAAGAGVVGAAVGAALPTVGGRLMGGSLDLLARAFDDSRLRLDALGALFGEAYFGPTTQMVMGGLEGLLFGGCVVGALVAARRALAPGS